MKYIGFCKDFYKYLVGGIGEGLFIGHHVRRQPIGVAILHHAGGGILSGDFVHHQVRLGLHVQCDSIGGAGQAAALGGEHQLMNPRSISGITIVGARFNGGLAVHAD